MEDYQTIEIIQTALSDAAKEVGGDSNAFNLLKLALCGYMTLEQQEKLILDAKKRGLIESI